MIYIYNNSYYLAIDGSLIRLEQSVLTEEDVKDCPCDKDNNIYNSLLRFINKDESGFIDFKKIEDSLYVLGFRYIARDGDGDLYAYTAEPEWWEYENSFLIKNIEDNTLELNNNWFTDIKKKEVKKICN